MEKRKKASMQERGYKAVTSFHREAEYQALVRFTKDAKKSDRTMSHSKYLAQLAREDLIKRGYLVPMVVAQLPKAGPARSNPPPKGRQTV